MRFRGKNLLLVLILCFGNPLYGQEPTNNNFANAQVITEVSGNVSGSNVNATLEDGEPTKTDGFEAGGSVWFSWEAPETGVFRFELTAGFDSQLGIFSGEDLAGLTLQSESDTDPPGGDFVMVWVNEGANYRVRVTGFQAESGPFVLDWSKVPPPANDNLANAQVIVGTEVEGELSGSNFGATMELGEPVTTAGFEAGGSVWFLWRAPATGTFSIRLTADWDAQLAIFTGEEAGALTVLDESDPLDGEGDAIVILAAEEGASYRVRVSGYSIDRGPFLLELSIHPVFQKMYTFEASAGSLPLGCLVQGVDGDFYGATSIGGATDNGTLFKMTPDRVITTLVEFSGKTGPNKGGAQGRVTLVQFRDGEFYGTTERFGDIPATIFKVTIDGVFTTLVEFAEGENPLATLVQGSDGDFYGATSGRDEFDGTILNHGTIFRMTPAGVLTILLEFTGTEGPNLGSSPEAALVQGSDGNFYGTTPYGGADNQGTIFRMTPEGVLTTLFEFGRNDNGSQPYAALVQGKDGDFYGTTYLGGIGYGTAFKITSVGELTTLVQFTGVGGLNIGSAGNAALVLGSDGNFYGTTPVGGADDDGTVFMMTPEGVLTTLVEFSGTGDADVGASPQGALVLSSSGDFYGTTIRGGFDGNDVGTLFKVTPEGTLTTLVDFAARGGGGVGGSPAAALVLGNDGNFYGTTEFDGATDSGTIFKITPAGVATRLVEFTGLVGPNLGRSPQAALVQGSDGNFYGTTEFGGADDGGTVFKITPEGVLTTLVEFGNSENEDYGYSPTAALVQGSDGNFYGTTAEGGASNHGTVFSMTPAGVLTTLVQFTGIEGDNLGGAGTAAMVQGSDGNFYGTTSSGGIDDDGTVFKMTPGGVLTTLFDFGESQADETGRDPQAALIQGGDGDFYGTTASGGADDKGTIFKISPEGVLTILFDFGAWETDDNGWEPIVPLVEGSDGNFYGTTASGGVDNKGTVFTMTPEGVVTTFHEFRNDGSPEAPLVVGPDGDLYGTQTAFGTSGAIFRLVYRGVPTAYLLAPPEPLKGLTSASAVLRSIVNPRGAVVEEVRIEYGTDGLAFSNTVAIPLTLAGYQGIEVGRTVSGLTVGTTYYYRFRIITTSAVETVSPVQSFSTLAEPTVAIVPASEITPGTARLNGLVNARNFDADVIFQYGLDGNSFSSFVMAEPEMVMGNVETEVSAQIAGLDAGQTYYYRLVAFSIGGTAVSGQGSFRTLTEPVSVLGGASALSTTRAQVVGSVDARGADAAVDFEYWPEDKTSANAIKVPATPAVVSGEGSIEVQATLTGLAQGTTYRYRIRAVGSGGTGLSETGTFSLSLLSGLDQTFPDPPTSATGEVTVNIDPPETGGWRFAGERQWRLSGEIVANLASGDRLLEFRPVPGFISPPTETVSLTSSNSKQVLEATYFRTPASGTGTLTVSLKPDNLAGAQWRFSGETVWRDGQLEISGLTRGTYLVESKPVADRVTPPTTSVRVEDGVPGALTMTYVYANNPTGKGPGAVSFADVSNNEDLPLAYLGQIRSPVGSSTGFVVKRRVVATAGHVVFDDGSLSFISDLKWLFQRHSSEHEPMPQTPRGFYLAAGYADARQEQGVQPGEGTPESQDLDYAVLYFQEEAGRGGVGGFLASEAKDENEFLSSSVEKMLAGYPVDGIPEGDLGKVHATPVFTDALIPAFGETWTTPAVYGVGGISGGPLFARHSNGAFYPAAIYLGGSGQAVVRAIDSDVVDLFLRAEASGNGGENNTGGGITHTSVAGNISATDPGALRVVIEPASAIAMGAGWQLVPESTWRQGGSLKSGLSAGKYNLVFNPVDGFQAPEKQVVEVTGGQFTTVTFTYEEDQLTSSLETWRQDNFGTILDSGVAADVADPDKDGVTNINEYTAGTDPNNSIDFLKFTTAIKTGTTFSAECAGKSGRIYVLQRDTELDGEWTSVSSQGPLAAEGTVLLTDDSAPADTSFYRIEVSMP
jgi:uncharacterized repeat protein (TIGR03803 family)